MRYYVVFEGRRSGITDSLPECLSLTQGYSGNSYQGYKNFDEAVMAWVKHCKFHGRDIHYIQRGMLQTESTQFNDSANMFSKKSDASASTSSATQESTHEQITSESTDGGNEEECYVDDVWEQQHVGVISNAEESGSSEWILQFSMQAQLEKMCNYLRIPQIVYSIHKVQQRRGITFVRYSASLNQSFIGTPITTCVGRFARSDFDAMEDVAAMVIRRLLNATGKKIRDFNYYNVRIMEKKLNHIEEEKLQLSMEIKLLTEEMDEMKLKGKGRRF